MARAALQQQKILRLMQIFLQETDEDHGLTMEQLLDRLQQFGISAERKSIYDNIETLNQCGMDIIMERRGGKSYYSLASRQFEPTELRLLADAVASSRFITAKKSDQLIGKLATLASNHQGGALKRQVLVTGRIKNMNETIFYLVDELNRAIAENAAVTFRYFDWALEKGTLQKVARHDGALYTVSPWQLLWEDEYYYLIAFDHQSQSIHHYRVDRMAQITLTEGKRQGEAQFKALRSEKYSTRVFGMFGGQAQSVTIAFPAHLLNAMIDRFGKDCELRTLQDGRLTIRGEVVPSSHFYGWLLSLGEGVTIQTPQELKEDYKTFLQKRLNEQ
jgi:predicted DNA-binding transcriptional regulator YafY